MPRKHAFLISLAAGLPVAIIVAMTWLSALRGEPLRPCGNLPQNYAPIIAFELARSADDLQAIFGTPDDPCRMVMVERMDAINWMDDLVFIPAYGAMMAFFFLGMRARNAALGTFGFWVAVVAALGDFAENACLKGLTPALDPSSAWFALLPWATGVKWLGLGVAGAVAAAIYVKSAGPRLWNSIAALLCAAAFVSTVAAIAAPAKFGPFVSLGVGLSWLVYLVAAAVAVVHPASVAEPARPG
ncbi:MAG TPA: hypothetical protein VH814_14940 [Steroidobacteraceae bacterium]|jgi:hypothetical protein